MLALQGYKGGIKLAHCGRHFNSCTLLTRQSASVIKVGVTAMYQAFKEERAVVIKN